jgi:hypothetical protein
MNSFWQNIYDDCKDRRYGNLFFASFFIALGLAGAVAAIGAITGSNNGPEILLALVPGVIVFAAGLAWRCYRGRKRREEALKYANLSRDELAKARSKLKRQMNFKATTKPARRVTPRSPDTYLKY